MCLLVKSKNIRQAKRDIPVYKIVAHGHCVRFISPFFGELYERGDLKSVTHFTGSDHTCFSWSGSVTGTSLEQVKEIDQGFHTYTNKRYALSRVGTASNYKLVVRCYIPKGTSYIVGQRSDIVSLRLRVGTALIRNKLGQLFNKTGKENERLFDN